MMRLLNWREGAKATIVLFLKTKMVKMLKSHETVIAEQDIAASIQGQNSGMGEALRGALHAWDRVQRRLRAELGEDVYASWFKSLELASHEEGAITLSVPTKFLRNWIQQHFQERIRAHIIHEMPDIRTINITVRQAGARPAPRQDMLNAQHSRTASALRPAMMSGQGAAAKAALASSHAQPATSKAVEACNTAGSGSLAEPLSSGSDGESQIGSPLDARLVLASFQVGRSNMMAHAAAMQVVQAKKSDVPVFNPLYIHANVGLGKTHLLQGAAQAVEASGRRVLYLTAERFMYGFVSSLKSQTAMAFKETLRGIDVLVIDDAQFLHGPKSQQEFCHTLNALIDAGKQVIVAADRPPAELEGVEERVQSRLAGGLVVEIGALDEALRIKILQSRIATAKAIHAGFDVPEAVVEAVARAITANGRDLEGAVNRLLAHATLNGGILDVPAAEEAIRDLVRHREPKRVKIEDIQRLVASHYSVSRADILSSRRTATVVRPRQIAMYLAKSLTLRSLPEIGRRFGGRDHTTVLHAVRKIEGMVTKDQTLAGEIDHLKRMLQE
jgi:chromosomal replication initiator protein